AYKDGITKLNNKNYLLETLNLVVIESSIHFSLLMIGFNNYRMEDDYHQYNISKDILTHIAYNLINLNQERYEIGFYTGDIFYALLDHSDDATTFSNNIVDLYGEPVTIDSLSLDLSIHVGIYDFVYGTSALDTLSYAEIAMYQARKDKDMGYTTFSEDLLKTL
nr:diguanylate cyclase [Vallitaleaceae bacterium]